MSEERILTREFKDNSSRVPYPRRNRSLRFLRGNCHDKKKALETLPTRIDGAKGGMKE